jgi:hypothetical protein
MSKISNNATANQVAFGQFGSDLVTTTAGGGDVAVTVPSGMVIIAITVLSSTSELSVLTPETGSGSFNDTGVQLPAGITLFGRWSAATLDDVDAGAIVAYFGPANKAG